MTMITLNKINELASLSTQQLTQLIQDAGYTKDEFVNSTFVGLSNTCEFCYRVEYVDGFHDIVSANVFVTYNSRKDKINIDY